MNYRPVPASPPSMTSAPPWSYGEAFTRNLGLVTADEQQRLRSSRVAIAGLGGVGGIDLVTLARLGIGRFTIADPDVFETRNTNRQYGATLSTQGRPKADVMRDIVLDINPEAEIRMFRDPLGAANADAFLEGCNVLVDGIDAFEIDLRRVLFRNARARGIYALGAGGRAPNAESRIPSGIRTAASFGVAVAPFALVILWLNHALYGGALRSGYGQLNAMFSPANISSNALRYGRWLLQTQTVVIFLGFLASRVVPKDRRGRVWLALALILTTAAIYFAYTPFEDWSYLRFLMPAIALLIVLTSVVLAASASRLGFRASCVLLTLIAVALGFNGVASARDRLAFQMHALEQRYRSSGMVVRDRLPPAAAPSGPRRR